MDQENSAHYHLRYAREKLPENTENIILSFKISDLDLRAGQVFSFLDDTRTGEVIVLHSQGCIDFRFYTLRLIYL